MRRGQTTTTIGTGDGPYAGRLIVDFLVVYHTEKAAVVQNDAVEKSDGAAGG